MHGYDYSREKMRSWAEVGGPPTHGALRAPWRPNSKSFPRGHVAGAVPTFGGPWKPFGNHPGGFQKQAGTSNAASWKRWGGFGCPLDMGGGEAGE
ncbi:Hypothetical protein AA314_01545 [Archangium gephyra]|uniref:Uncharacterized protein n=1 Tax=Archangium gephyra TaxID=48 RepID=A0AAC8Q3N3_9BACT|nr:Hypothetical protein AA314_01545 [Archangium gephyra]